MVRNTKGGKGAKSMARKSASSGSGMPVPVPTSDMEHFAVVSQMFGPSCNVILLDGTTLLCHIRNKFKGRHKSTNLISVGSLLLIGLREWERDQARKNCDLIFVYDNSQKTSLQDRFTLPSIEEDHHHHDTIFFDHSSTEEILHDNTPTATDFHHIDNNTFLDL